METVTGFWPVFSFGMIGGFAVELLRWWKLRESKNLPEYVKSPFYWAVTFLMIVCGGLICCLYGFEDRSPITLVHIGASAPAIISAFTSRSADSKIKMPLGQKRGDRDRNVNLLNFLSFKG